MSCNCNQQSQPYASLQGFGFRGLRGPGDDYAGEAPGGQMTVGMANPSSENCRAKGGTERVVRYNDPGGNPAGDQGFCDFPDGSSCESWAFYRGECKPGDNPAPNGMRLDMKRDLIAGGVGLALPFAYGYLAPKKWPKANVFAQVAMVIGGYFAAAWAYSKITEA
jgi:putative hemolysin